MSHPHGFRNFARSGLKRLVTSAALLLVGTLFGTDCLAATTASPPPSSPAYVLVFRGGAQILVGELPVFADGHVTYILLDGKPGISSEKSIDREATEKLNRLAAEKRAALAATPPTPSAAPASPSPAATAGVSEAKRKAAIQALESRSGTGDSATAAADAKARDEGEADASGPEAGYDAYRDSDGRNGEYWARRARDLDAALSAAKTESHLAERYVRDLELMLSASTDSMSISPEHSRQLSEAQDAADRARANVENAQRDYDNLQDEMRTKGALPGWTR